MTAPTVDDPNRLGAHRLHGSLGVAVQHADATQVRAGMAVNPMAPDDCLHAGSAVMLSDTCHGPAGMPSRLDGVTGFTTPRARGRARRPAGLHDDRAASRPHGPARDTRHGITLFRCTPMMLRPQAAWKGRS